MELEINLLQVDNDENVYLNPDQRGMATLLRKHYT